MNQKEFEKLSYREKIRYNLPAIIAISNHEDIEIKSLDSDGYKATGTLNYIHIYPYRVKPKTVKTWFNLYLKDDPELIQGFGYPSKEIADIASSYERVACIEIEVPVEV